MAIFENLVDKEGFLGGVFHERLLASPQYILRTDNTSVSSATSSPLSVINTGQFPPFSWGAQQQHSSNLVCQGAKPAACSPCCLILHLLLHLFSPSSPPSPPYSLPVRPAFFSVCHQVLLARNQLFAAPPSGRGRGPPDNPSRFSSQ